MKILYHHRTASKDGQAVHIEEMIGSLRALGHEVLVVAPGGEAEGADKGKMGDDVSWVGRLRQHLPRWFYELLELAYSLVAYRKLSKAAREFKPDVLYERYNLFLLSGVMLKKRTGLPLLLEVNAPLALEREQHSGLSLRRLAYATEAWVWRGADFVLPVTEVLAQDVRAAGVPSERIVVAPNGINEDHFSHAPDMAAAKARLGWPDALVLGFTGFVRSWHSMDMVLRWLASAQAPAHARLLLVGDGPARQELEDLSRELGIADRVKFTGVVSRDEVPALVAAFDIALQPAVTAYASPLKVVEYLALSKAIVAPDQPNIMEVLEHERNALLFTAGSEASLRAALEALSKDASLREQLGREARATIDRMGLTWDNNAQRAVDLGRRALVRA